MKNTYKTALGGVITALAVVCMLLTAVIPVATYSCPIIAGALLVAVVIDLGAGWAFGVYAAVSLLSLLVVPDKEAVVCFVFLFGYYPILKQYIEKKKKRILQWVMKLLVFNIAAVMVFYITVYLLFVPKESFNIGGVYLPWVFLAFGNIIFIMYDAALTKIIILYIVKLRKFFSKKSFK